MTLRHPLATALLLLALVALAAMHTSTPSRAPSLTVTYYAIATPDTGFRVINPDRSSADPIVRALVETPDRVAVFEIRDRLPVSERFLWRPPIRPVGPRIEPTVDPGWPTPMLHAARHAVIDDLAAHPPHAPLAQRLRLAPDGGLRPHWPSILWNLCVWTLIALMAWSLRWIPPTLSRRRAKRRSRLLASGFCPGCRYPIPADSARCPECGEVFSPDRNGSSDPA